MKHRKLLSLLCLMLAISLPVISFGEEEEEKELFTSGDWEYCILEDGTAEITDYNGNAESLFIPDQLDGKTVTALGDGAFFYSDFLMSVTIPDSITSVKANPFAGCSSLTDISVSPEHSYLAVMDGVLFSKPDKRLICYPCAFTASSYKIPQGTSVIGDSAFSPVTPSSLSPFLIVSLL